MSGGADSTALLLGLHALAREPGLELRAAHLHHGLRGAEADQDLAFVRALCDRLGVPLTSATWDARRRMRARGLAGEAGLRTLRREFLAAAARRAGCTAIATAHTADDQLETVLMRLGRGTGLAGLGGMRPRTTSRSLVLRGGRDGGRERAGSRPALTWIKPLLEVTRAEIERDLAAAGVSWREDRSNLDPAFTRNRVRHGAIPALVAALAPGADPARARAALARRVARAAAEAGGAAAAVEALADHALSALCRIRRGEYALDSRGVATYPSAARRTVLRRLWQRVTQAAEGLTHAHLEALSRLLAGGRGGARVEFPGGWRAERDRGWIRFRRPGGAPAPAGGLLPVPGRLRWGAGEVRGKWTTGAAARRRLAAKTADEEYFAARELKGALELRTAGADERFVPFGRRRPARVCQFLGKQGVSREFRRRPTVLADARGILWVVGVRRAARAPVTTRTRRVLWVHAERHD
ncbi:MAG: tRNA lysidine(34) synthetase TilS [Candidatus Eisenbacteria bacterium]|nr:tRNA lysidine(34) synthetase TilS [Candidatus Eisenbacteria bacterium]